MIEDLQELTEGWWDKSLYPGWVSTKEFADTGERTGFLAPALGKPESAEKSQAADLLPDALSDDEEAVERENLLKTAVLGMTRSGRYVFFQFV